ncbi:MAG: hypothetical protein WB297_01285 [Actinomycetota bacterium]
MPGDQGGGHSDLGRFGTGREGVPHRVYANLASNQTTPGPLSFSGAEAIAVSRLDFPADVTETTAPDIIADQGNWYDPVIASKQNPTVFSDKEQVWVDNAENSPFFGNAYVRVATFKSLSRGNAFPRPSSWRPPPTAATHGSTSR